MVSSTQEIDSLRSHYISARFNLIRTKTTIKSTESCKAAGRRATLKGRYFYKYVTFDENMNVLKLLTENKIKFSAPSAFNDPFDCNPCFSASSVPRKLKPELFARVNWVGSPAQRLLSRQKAVNRVDAAFDSGTFIMNTMSDIGILSLSRTPWSVLMWSHYTKHHQGFAVEFHQPELIPASDDAANRWLVTFPVDYVDKRPVLGRWSDSAEVEVERIFMVKSSEWKYEEEERAIDFERGPGIYEYEPRLLKSVIAGVNIGEMEFDLLVCAVKGFNKKWGASVALYRAEVDPKHYRLRIPGFRRRVNVEQHS